MDKKDFESMDEKFMQELKKIRQAKVPSELLRGFSASVESRLGQKDKAPLPKFRPRLSLFPVWAPVLAVLIFAVVASVKPIGLWMPQTFQVSAELASVPVSEISDEVDALRELGVWKDEDEALTGVDTETELEKLVYTESAYLPGSSLA